MFKKLCSIFLKKKEARETKEEVPRGTIIGICFNLGCGKMLPMDKLNWLTIKTPEGEESSMCCDVCLAQVRKGTVKYRVQD